MRCAQLCMDRLIVATERVPCEKRSNTKDEGHKSEESRQQHQKDVRPHGLSLGQGLVLRGPW